MALLITTDRSSAKISSTLRINASGDNFPSIINTLVYVGGIVSKILYHSNTTITIAIPKGIDSGSQTVKVYDKINNVYSNIVSIEITYNDEKFEDEKLTAYVGRFKPTTSGTISVYSRDMGYSNYTEINDATSVIQNVLSIILTNKGERLFNSNFGCNVQNILFSSVANAAVLEKSILNEIKTQVSLYEHRVTILTDISFVDFNENTNSLYIILYLEVPGGSVKELGVTISSVTKEPVSA